MTVADFALMEHPSPVSWPNWEKTSPHLSRACSFWSEALQIRFFRSTGRKRLAACCATFFSFVTTQNWWTGYSIRHASFWKPCPHIVLPLCPTRRYGSSSGDEAEAWEINI